VKKLNKLKLRNIFSVEKKKKHWMHNTILTYIKMMRIKLFSIVGRGTCNIMTSNDSIKKKNVQLWKG